jgi:hypothetical protein
VIDDNRSIDKALGISFLIDDRLQKYQHEAFFNETTKEVTRDLSERQYLQKSVPNLDLMI